MKKTFVIAHRGASGHAPENTMISFQKAIDMGADGIELDVHISKDDKLIVCHDERVDRTTNGIGFIKDLTLDEIKKLDAGYWYDKKYANEKIPTLEEVLYLFQGKDILINIELKNGIIQYDKIEEKVIRVLEKFKLMDRTIISSFNHYSLIKIKEINSSIKTGALYMCGLVNPWDYVIRLNIDVIHPIYFALYPDLIKKCKERNVEINTYTVNCDEDMKKVIDLGVNGIITNYPDKAKKILEGIY
ncbi:glycerophosphodiester phosphodiesterase [Sporosalibacterium faouarense]|uniref:glycerophosphodiester phosphodiesterase n=1 Tax=Sporosalibacterium faouarense TaxID=516123 RepID=UPI00141CF5F5|nr:glycerophosphodiester phosphodiesterase [Sporosalibacterium faouarense]MTI48597.1 glycerophosphodiester phosphodiesterase [Bacillota bacterium]